MSFILSSSSPTVVVGDVAIRCVSHHILHRHSSISLICFAAACWFAPSAFPTFSFCERLQRCSSFESLRKYPLTVIMKIIFAFRGGHLAGKSLEANLIESSGKSGCGPAIQCYWITHQGAVGSQFWAVPESDDKKTNETNYWYVPRYAAETLKLILSDANRQNISMRPHKYEVVERHAEEGVVRIVAAYLTN